MKKLLIAAVLATTVGTAQAVNAIPMNHPRPIPVNSYSQGYHNGYNNGYHHGKDDQKEKIAKAVGATILIAASVLVIYELAKPSQHNPGQVQLARF